MDGKSANADRAVAEIARGQHGVVALRQLRAVGISEHAARARTLAGRLHRIHQGVYAVGHEAVSPEGRWMAAVLAVGGGPTNAAVPLERWGAAISHRSAAELWGLLDLRECSVEVSVPGDGGKRRRSGIRLHRSVVLSPAQVTLRGGIPVTTPTRTILDLRRVVPGREHRRAVRQAEVLGLPLDDEIESDRTRSDLEGDFLNLCRSHRLPAPEVNVRIGADLVDFLWSDRCLVVETDSYQYHRGRLAFQNDHDRDLRLRTAGYEVLRFSEKQLDDESELVAATLGAALRVGRDAGDRKSQGQSGRC